MRQLLVISAVIPVGVVRTTSVGGGRDEDEEVAMGMGVDDFRLERSELYRPQHPAVPQREREHTDIMAYLFQRRSYIPHP